MATTAAPQDFTLENVLPNRFQPRKSRTREHLWGLALSIATNGLQQVPVGRPQENGAVELAFGMTRLAAFQLLNQLQEADEVHAVDFGWTQEEAEAEDGLYVQTLAALQELDGTVRFDTFPVLVEDMTDEVLFERGIIENNDRADLTPIDQATAMKFYMESFGKSSGEAGRLFKKSGSAVRNLLRLLELPQEVQGYIADGAISQTTARKLLSVQSIAPEKVTQAATALAKEKPGSSEEIDQTIATWVSSKDAHVLWEGWRGGTACAGVGLWELAVWTPDGFEEIKPAQFAKWFPTQTAEIRKARKKPADDKAIREVATYAQGIMEDAGFPSEPSDLAKAMGISLATAQLIWVLLRPPVCAQCPFYAKVKSQHYCGVKPCWENKKNTWVEIQASKYAHEHGIPLYDEERDGKVYEVAFKGAWGNAFDAEGVFHDEYAGYVESAYVTWWKQEPKPDHFRIRPHWSKDHDRHDFTEDPCAQLISVRSTIPEEKKRLEEAKQQKAEERAKVERERNRGYQNRRDAVEWLTKHFPSEAFFSLTEDLDDPQLSLLYALMAYRYDTGSFKGQFKIEDEKQAKRAFLAHLMVRFQISDDVVDQGGIQGAIQRVQELAEMLKVKLPENWDQTTLPEPEYVDEEETETGETDDFEEIVEEIDDPDEEEGA